MFENLVIEAGELTVELILLRVALAFLLGVVTAALYYFTNDSPGASRSFLHTLAMLSMVTAMVMMIIGNSIARAFSLVGALSIIRFRTAVKDTRDTAFVFLALAAGMAAGTTQTMLVVAAFAGVGVFVYLLHQIRFGGGTGSTVALTFSAAVDELSHEASMAVIRKHGRMASLAGLHTQRQGTLIEVSYTVELRRGASPHRLVADLTALPGIARVAVSPGDRVVEP
ncbi:DUF4956 domain-containing protein [Candidatus Fermentibacteria bacterium]|nr:DUF4956 domain-containing protein [Candidatus Fermentibacteria bacterium]